MVAATSLAATAPLLSGLLLAWAGPSTAVLFFAAAVAAAALVATVGRGLHRTEPITDETSEHSTPAH